MWTASNCVVTAAVLRACRMPLALLWRLWCVDFPFSWNEELAHVPAYRARDWWCAVLLREMAAHVLLAQRLAVLWCNAQSGSALVWQLVGACSEIGGAPLQGAGASVMLYLCPRDWRCSGARLKWNVACSEIGGALLQGAEWREAPVLLYSRDWRCLGCVRDWWCPGAGSIWKSSSMVADRCLLRDWWCSVARCRSVCFTDWRFFG